jgi:hypothetical protein
VQDVAHSIELLARIPVRKCVKEAGAGKNGIDIAYEATQFVGNRLIDRREQGNRLATLRLDTGADEYRRNDDRAG